MKEFTEGRFVEVLDDPNVNVKDVERVVLCTGKVFFDLQEYQQKKKIKNTALVRIEQLYPFPKHQLDVIFKKYKKAEVIWVQEEPYNMGYYAYMQRFLPEVPMKVVARKSSASPATGYSKVHKIEQEKIITQAFEI